MNRSFFRDQKFENVRFSGKAPEPADYESCIFTGCDFSDSDLSDSNFIECAFIACNLSLTKLINTSIKETIFRDCKLLGLHFEDCSGYSCPLNLIIVPSISALLINLS